MKKVTKKAKKTGKKVKATAKKAPRKVAPARKTSRKAVSVRKAPVAKKETPIYIVFLLGVVLFFLFLLLIAQGVFCC